MTNRFFRFAAGFAVVLAVTGGYLAGGVQSANSAAGNPGETPQLQAVGAGMGLFFVAHYPSSRSLFLYDASGTCKGGLALKGQPGSNMTEIACSGEPQAASGREQGEGATKGSLGAIRSALSIFYGDAEGAYPHSLTELTVNGKYLSSIPKAMPGNHPASDRVFPACSPQELTDQGGWAYCNQAGHNNFGSVMVNCTHKDSKGNLWSDY